ncbi:hypothetical protein [Variovorax sp. PMC12]|uniref:hypothetical protein n=1 Tax=Variovorax sp. PMC12 TaxID=2126319 RepID=UPI000D1349D9|nr:hypothetical protein [Variovorax sp. PMC12]AVQ81676.1 hypothetical protein C4F17_12350 [Variovorax sp. PMC12]
MIRARESLDQWAQKAHDILDQAQRGASVTGAHINWALAYLGDRAGSVRVPADLLGGYDAKESNYGVTA